MHAEAKKNTIQFDELKRFLNQNEAQDWETINLFSDKQLGSLNWEGIEQDKLFKAVKAYQRLVRLLGKNKPKLILALLKNNLHSAIQIAAMNKPDFLQRYAALFEQEEEGFQEKVYGKALAIRSQVLLNYISRIQNNEAHAQGMKSLAAV